jgi:hypothetical protein
MENKRMLDKSKGRGEKLRGGEAAAVPAKEEEATFFGAELQAVSPVASYPQRSTDLPLLGAFFVPAENRTAPLLQHCTPSSPPHSQLRPRASIHNPFSLKRYRHPSP